MDGVLFSGVATGIDSILGGLVCGREEFISECFGDLGPMAELFQVIKDADLRKNIAELRSIRCGVEAEQGSLEDAGCYSAWYEMVRRVYRS